jgi:hypothetical protein
MNTCHGFLTIPAKYRVIFAKSTVPYYIVSFADGGMVINPLAYYKAGKTPVGVWIGSVLLVMEMLMQLRGMFMVDRLPVHTLIVTTPLLILALIGIIRRRLIGVWLGIIFFSLCAYAPMFVIPNLPFKDWWCVLVWWVVSALGIASLISNRRWFDENVVHFECSDV